MSSAFSLGCRVWMELGKLSLPVSKLPHLLSMASLGCFHTSDMRDSRSSWSRSLFSLLLPSWDLKTSPDENSIASNFLLSWWLPQWVGSLLMGTLTLVLSQEPLFSHISWLYSDYGIQVKVWLHKGRETHWIVPSAKFWKLEWESLGATEGCELVLSSFRIEEEGLTGGHVLALSRDAPANKYSWLRSADEKPSLVVSTMTLTKLKESFQKHPLFREVWYM